MAIEMSRVTKVRFKKSVRCFYQRIPDSDVEIEVEAGTVIGNVVGHTRGVAIYDHGESTVNLYLRTEDFTEVWCKVPKDAIEVGPKMGA